jgi:hypothetical protein
MAAGRPSRSAEAACQDRQADQQADQFAADRTPGHAGNTPAQFQAEQDGERDVGAIEHDLQDKAEPSLAAPKHVAEDRIVGEREGRPEQPDADIDVHRPEHARLGSHKPAAGQRNQRREQR